VPEGKRSQAHFDGESHRSAFSFSGGPEKLEDIAPVIEICMASAGIDFQFLLTRPSTGTTDVESEPWGAHISDSLGIAFPGSGSTMLCSIGALFRFLLWHE
jgi:hypothetical protein